MAIFNSYVSLPEGNPRLFLWIKHIQKSPTWQWHEGHKPRDAPPYDRVDLGWRANRHLWCCRTAGSALPRPGTAGFWMVLDWGTWGILRLPQNAEPKSPSHGCHDIESHINTAILGESSAWDKRVFFRLYLHSCRTHLLPKQPDTMEILFGSVYFRQKL